MARHLAWHFDIRQMMATMALIALLAWLYARFFLIGMVSGVLLIGIVIGLHGVYRKHSHGSRVVLVALIEPRNHVAGI